jgi:hypothetical protein
MSATTFRDLYDNPVMDPDIGLYSDVLSVFVVSGDEWDASLANSGSMAKEALYHSPTTCSALVSC